MLTDWQTHRQTHDHAGIRSFLADDLKMNKPGLFWACSHTSTLCWTMSCAAAWGILHALMTTSLIRSWGMEKEKRRHEVINTQYFSSVSTTPLLGVELAQNGDAVDSHQQKIYTLEISLSNLWDVIITQLKDLCNANACWLVLIYNTLIITNVAKRLFKYVPYILL